MEPDTNADSDQMHQQAPTAPSPSDTLDSCDRVTMSNFDSDTSMPMRRFSVSGCSPSAMLLTQSSARTTRMSLLSVLTGDLKPFK